MQKIKDLFTSRKFLTSVAALVVIWLSVYTGASTPAHAVDLTVAALGAFTVGTGLENIGNSTIVRDAVSKALRDALTIAPIDMEIPDHK